MKKSTQRIAYAAAAAIIGSFALAACGSDTESSSKSGTGKPITLWVDVERAPALKKVAADFKEATGVEVKLVTKDFATVDTDFISQVPSGEGPDIIVSPHDKLGSFVAAGVVAPIELGDKEGDFAEAAVQAMTYDGKIYGVPYSIENVALLRNTALVPDAVETFDEVIANGKEFAGGAKDKYPFLLGLSPEQGDPYHLYPLQTSFGSQVFAQSEDGSYDASKLVLGDANGVKFATALKQWGADGVLNANIDGDKAKEFFLAGKSPYFLTGPWNVPDIAKAGIDYAIDPLPSAGGETARPFIGVNGFYRSSKSANAVAATNFIVNYLSTEAAQTALFKVGGRPPALTAAYEAASSDADVKAFGEIGQTGAPMPAIPEMGAVWADWGNAELALIKGKGDPKAVWEKAAANIESKIG